PELLEALLPPALRERLARYGYADVDDLAEACPVELDALPHVGARRVAVIRRALEVAGYPEHACERCAPSPAASASGVHEVEVRRLAEVAGVPRDAAKAWLSG